MISLWKPVITKSTVTSGKFLISGRLLLTQHRLNNMSDHRNDRCKPSPPPCGLPEPPTPPYCPPDPSECEPSCCQPPPNEQKSEGNENKSTRTMKSPERRYTLLMDLGKKGMEAIQLIRNSNEYDFAKEQLKRAVNLTMTYAKQYGSILQKNVSEQLEKVKAKDAAKEDHKKSPTKK